jgi:hypothetical protein
MQLLIVSGRYHIYRNGAVSNQLMDVVKNILIFANNFRKKHIPFSFFIKIITFFQKQLILSLCHAHFLLFCACFLENFAEFSRKLIFSLKSFVNF